MPSASAPSAPPLPDAASTLTALLEAFAARAPDAVACRSRVDGRWQAHTWRELEREALALAAGWTAAGLRQGDRVAIRAPTLHRWAVAQWASWLAGASVVGVDPRASAAECAEVARTCAIRGLVVDAAADRDLFPAEMLPGLAVELHLRGGPDDPRGWERSLAFAAGAQLPTPADAAAEAIVVFTSGTTGAARAIPYTHAQALVAARTLAGEFAFDARAGDRCIAWLPLSALFQQMLNLRAFAAGVEVWFLDEPRDLQTALREVRPAYALGLPRLFEKVVEGVVSAIPLRPLWLRRALLAGVREPPSRGSVASVLMNWLVYRRVRELFGGRLRFAISGSAALPPRILRFFDAAGIRILEAYGLSENVVPMSANRPARWRNGSVGLPFAASRIRFAEDGEIEVSGPGIFAGYLGSGRPPERFTTDGWYRTGDLGRLDEDGFLWLTGRKAEIIKTSTGRRIAPALVEDAYRQSELIDQIVVVGDDRKRLGALVTLRAEAVARALGGGPPADQPIASSPAVRALVAADLERFGAALAPYERIGPFAILARPFSAADGEVTATFKLRRRTIAERHVATIDAMYAEDPS